jgi:hypothetical protein
MIRTTLLSAAFSLSFAVAAAQEPIPACESQQELEQVLGSDGQITPDGCRNVTVSVLDIDGQRLCLLDLSAGGEGLVDRLREAAISERWWVRCDDLTAAVR